MLRFPRLAILCCLALGMVLTARVVQAKDGTAHPSTSRMAQLVQAAAHPAMQQASKADYAGSINPAAVLQRDRSAASRIANASSSDATPYTRLDFESDVIELVNDERAQEGCPALTAHPTLREVAYAHSKDMHDRDFFDHVNPDDEDPGDRIAETDYDAIAWGENIAIDYMTPAAVMDAWMDSAGHRANILNCNFLDIGVGYYQVGSQGGRYWTQVFGRQADAPDPDPEPEPDPDPTPNPDPDPLPELMQTAFLPLSLKPGSASTRPGEILTNGDFEDGPGVGWHTEYLSGDTWPMIGESPNSDILLPYSGQYIAWLGGVYEDTSVLSQEVTLPEGTLTLEYAYVIASREAGCNYDTGYVELIGADARHTLVAVGLCGATSSDDWQIKQVNLSPYAGETWTLRFSVETDNSLNSNFFLDDVTIRLD